jgi:2-polyprenyl-3-methyl-5-hydroxy-6-metoxy-1,4-benzoquinol methylase
MTLPVVASNLQAKRQENTYSKIGYTKTYFESYAPYLTRSYLRGLERIQQYRPQDSILLDIGCGFGFFLNLARETGYRVEGIEVTPSLAEEGRTRYHIPITCGDFQETETNSKTYDIITAWDFLEHCVGIRGILNKIRNLVTEKGVFLLRVPDFSFMQGRYPSPFLESYLSQMYPVDFGEHIYHFSLDSLLIFLKRAGFELMEIWPSQEDEYTPRDFPTYSDLLLEMRRYNLACEMNLMCKPTDRMEA